MEFFEAGGWGMYPVVVFGAVTLLVAGQQLRRYEASRNLAVLWLIGLTANAGVLGTATGMQASSRFIEGTPDKWIWLIGLQESLNNLVLAGALCAVAMLMMLAAHTLHGPPSAVSASPAADDADRPEALLRAVGASS